MRLWPTPTASDPRGAQRVESCKEWRSRGRNLPEAVVLAEAAELQQVKASTPLQGSRPAGGPSRPPSPACQADNHEPEEHGEPVGADSP